MCHDQPPLLSSQLPNLGETNLKVLNEAEGVGLARGRWSGGALGERVAEAVLSDAAVAEAACLWAILY